MSALEDALQLKEATGVDLSAEENVVLSIEALQREVNNGGFDQFLLNSSQRFAPIIVDSLNRINAPEVAEIATNALAAHVANEAVERPFGDDDEELIALLEVCDQRFYEIAGIDDRLFTFVLTHRERISF